ncbi:hypothetical protein BSKO_12050 [Bryopsis sp. KO-2023]|nr:hypothetical protein BSKO_12050 [Bryopsis sp. KO-2023]
MKVKEEGHEEAAPQSLIAGINAARQAQGLSEFELYTGPTIYQRFGHKRPSRALQDVDQQIGIWFDATVRQCRRKADASRSRNWPGQNGKASTKGCSRSSCLVTLEELLRWLHVHPGIVDEYDMGPPVVNFRAKL